MRKLMGLCVAVALCLVQTTVVAATGAAEPSAVALDFASYSHDEALAHSQTAIGSTLQGIDLLDAQGNVVSLESLHGKPVILSMIYTSCHHVCPSTTQFLQQAVNKARSALDEDSFHVLTVGFDTINDSPERMQQFAQRVGNTDSRWKFLAADKDNLAALTEQLGFIYYPSPKGFEHLVQASVIDADGVIYRQVYGMSFPLPVLIEPLKELVFGQPREQSTLDWMENKIRLFCTVYDPARDRYNIDYSVFIGTFVGLMVSLVFGRALYREWKRSLDAGV
jgi:protein SCO1/2